MIPIVSVCILLIAALCQAQFPPPSAPDSQAVKVWEQYKGTFVQADGRVIDIRQNGISHSESQGYGLLGSVLFNDRKAFQAIWQWTRNNMQARKDNLLPWSWGKRFNGQWGIIDYNNATDGDILLAYALLQGSARWRVPEYRNEGIKIVQGIRKHLAAQWQDKTYLLPAYYGFQKEGRLVLNPSYLIPAAYRSFAEEDDRTFWHKAYTDGQELLAAAQMGKMKLPPDWVSLTPEGIAIWDKKDPLFGYEAVRTILYQSWEKAPRYPDGLQAIFRFFEKQGYIPVQADLQKNEFSSDDASAGFYAVYALAARKTGLVPLSRDLMKKAADKAAAEKDDYYSATLFLLALRSMDD